VVQNTWIMVFDFLTEKILCQFSLVRQARIFSGSIDDFKSSELFVSGKKIFLRDLAQFYSAVFDKETLRQRADAVLNMKYLYLTFCWFSKNGYNTAYACVSW